jgi:hypothetical protein
MFQLVDRQYSNAYGLLFCNIVVTLTNILAQLNESVVGLEITEVRSSSFYVNFSLYFFIAIKPLNFS